MIYFLQSRLKFTLGLGLASLIQNGELIAQLSTHYSTNYNDCNELLYIELVKSMFDIERRYCKGCLP